MTSRGSLAYYLAAWVCGCFFMSLGLWMDIHWIRTPSSQGGLNDVGFLGLCFLGLIVGALPSLLFGWLLRWFVKIFHVAQLWIWIVAGAGLAFFLIWLLNGLAHLNQNPAVLPYAVVAIWSFLISGPVSVAEASIWVTIPAGAATSAVLFAVNRAFAQQPAQELTQEPVQPA